MEGSLWDLLTHKKNDLTQSLNQEFLIHSHDCS